MCSVTSSLAPSSLAEQRAPGPQAETDLKRETSRKLKEEIIDNDRLTVANLNRIKQLEVRTPRTLE